MEHDSQPPAQKLPIVSPPSSGEKLTGWDFQPSSQDGELLGLGGRFLRFRGPVTLGAQSPGHARGVLGFMRKSLCGPPQLQLKTCSLGSWLQCECKANQLSSSHTNPFRLKHCGFQMLFLRGLRTFFWGLRTLQSHCQGSHVFVKCAFQHASTPSKRIRQRL